LEDWYEIEEYEDVHYPIGKLSGTDNRDDLY
jgi:hypothetical protein